MNPGGHPAITCSEISTQIAKILGRNSQNCENPSRTARQTPESREQRAAWGPCVKSHSRRCLCSPGKVVGLSANGAKYALHRVTQPQRYREYCEEESNPRERQPRSGEP